MSVRALFISTKRYVVDVIRFQQGKNLSEILKTRATAEQEDSHRMRAMEIVAKDAELTDEHVKATAEGGETPKAGLKRSMKRGSMIKRKSSVTELDGVLSLETIKGKIVEGALELEKHGLCSSATNFQELLNSVAQDIRNQRVYRLQRKNELSKLTSTLLELDKKKAHMDDQISQYDIYIESCMKQITMKKKKKGGGGFFGRLKKKGGGAESSEDTAFHAGSYSYNARRLMDKGVLLSVDNVDHSKLKLAKISISCKEAGVMSFNASILGVKMDEEKHAFQELLQLQYNNVTTFKMFTYCTVNVNLMIHLINKKFYNK